MKLYAVAGAVALSMIFTADAEARSFRVSQVPNGSAFSCALCHVSSLGGGPRTGFGNQVFDTLSPATRASEGVDWAAIVDLDGDSDGYSNGLELGDPDGTWSIGDPNPEVFTNPADREDNPCGDEVLNGNEACDSDPMGAVCTDMGFGPGGEVSCSSTCRLDFSTCEGFEAANNSTANNSTANNSTPNNTTGNSDPGPTIDVDEGGDDAGDDDSACSTAGSTPGFLALVLGLFFIGRRRRTPTVR